MKKLVILTGLLGFSLIFSSIVHAQTINPISDDQIPSDLSLDLELAKKNPAPDLQAIVNSEIKQAQLVTNSGSFVTVQPQDIVSPSVKTEAKKNADNPDQTTSEQVISSTEVIEVTVSPKKEGETPEPTENENKTENPSVSIVPSSIPSGNLVPGTTVVEPDDNAAPGDNSENPNLPAPTSSIAVSPSPGESSNQPQAGDTNAPSPQSGSNNLQPTIDNSGQNNNVPATNPPAQPTVDNSSQNANPASSNPPSQNEQPTSPDNNNQQTQSNPPPANNPPPDNNNQQQQQQSNPPPSSDESNPSVQGVQTGPNVISQIISFINFLFSAKK